MSGLKKKGGGGSKKYTEASQESEDKYGTKRQKKTAEEYQELLKQKLHLVFLPGKWQAEAVKKGQEGHDIIVHVVRRV